MNFEEALAEAAQALTDYCFLLPFKQRPCLISLLEAIPETVSPSLYAPLLPSHPNYAPWIRERALEMERQTGNVLNALELLQLADYDAVDGGRLTGSLIAYDVLLNALPRNEALRLNFSQFEALQQRGLVPGWNRDLAKALLLDERLHSLSSAALSALYKIIKNK